MRKRDAGSDQRRAINPWAALRGLLVAAALLIGARGVSAQEERAIGNFAGVGVRAMGMGGAFAGMADDFTAVYWNPAGLAQMTNREMRVSFLRNSSDTESSLDGTAGHSELSNTRFGTLGFVYPYPVYQGSLVLAAGFTRIKDFDWSLNLKGMDQGLAADHTFQHEGESALAAVAAAVDVSPAISLGVTLGFLSGEDLAINEFNWTDPQDEFLERRFLARDTFADDYERSLYAVLGVMIRSSRDSPRYRLGAAITTGAAQKISYVFKGASSDSGYSLVEYDDGTVEEFPDDVFRDVYALSLPFEFGLGASVKPLSALTLAGSLHFAEWSQSEYKATDDNEFRANTSFAEQYTDVTRYHIGVEYQVPTVALDLRAGYYTDPIPFVGPRDLDPVADYRPIQITSDRSFITLGAGLLLDGVVQIDVAWINGSFSQAEELDGLIVETHDLNRLVFGVGYSF